MADHSLEGKVAIVTGATSGLGLETAAALAEKGAHVILGVRNTEQGEKVAKEIRNRGVVGTLEVGPALDLASQQSVHDFAEAINKRTDGLHILVNNAGLGFAKRWFTPEGVGGLAQINYFGPYTLTRLLEAKLVASKGRVVAVTSVTHRIGSIKTARGYLTDWRQGFYESNKLANVLFVYELQRRLGPKGVTACAADPGGVRTNIWATSPAYGKGMHKWIIDHFYSPPVVGAKTIVHAATVDWEKERKKIKSKSVPPVQDLRYYAEGVYALKMFCVTDHSKARQTFIGRTYLEIFRFWSFMDYPIWRATRGYLLGGPRPVSSAPLSYNQRLASELWEVSAEIAKLPVEPHI